KGGSGLITTTRGDEAWESSAHGDDVVRIASQNGHAADRPFGERLIDCFGTAPPPSSLIRLRGKQTLYALGETGNKLYVVESGRVKISVLSRCGKQCFLSIYVRGDVLGESCLLGSERMESAIAMVPSAVRQVSREQFVDALNEGGLLADYLGYMAARLG